MAIWHKFAQDNVAWVNRSMYCFPSPCWSCHTFLLFFCYLLFLVTLLIRQLVDWLANVCTTLQTCKVLILSSLLFLLCICLFFPRCFSDVSEDQVCSVMSKNTGEVIVENPQCNYSPFSLSLTQSHGTWDFLCPWFWSDMPLQSTTAWRV